VADITGNDRNRAAEVSGCAAERGSAGGQKMGLTCGNHMSPTEKEKRHFSEMRKPEGKTSFVKYPKASRVGWVERGGSSL
jgi:hypothetical protein